MAKQCEACAGLELRGKRSLGAGRIRNLLVGGLKETDGRRSLVTRRSPVDRRVFPPRPEGRRLAVGRRTIDRDT